MAGEGDESRPDSLLLPAAWGLIAFPAGLLLLTGLSLLAGGTIGYWQAPVALLLAAGTALAGSRWLFPAWTWPRRLLPPLAVLLIIGGAAWAGNAVYDLSWDGQAYHQDSIIQLAAGWNPVHSTTFPEPTRQQMELTHWAKGASYCGAAVYKFTGRIETGKLFHWVLILAAFCFSWSAFRASGLASKPLVLWFSLLAAVNPVSLGQVFTFYVDGLLASWLVILAANLFLYWKQERPWHLCAALVVTGSAVTVKFTAIPYAAFFIAVLVAGYLVRRRFRQAFRISWIFLLAGAGGAVCLGWNPYITNTLKHGHPFYPMAGPGAFYHTVLLSDQLPEDFYEQTRLEKMIRSVFSPVENIARPVSSRLKTPFVVLRSEYEQMSQFHAIRLGGWGPWFGPALLLAILLWILLLLTMPKQALLLLALSAPFLLPAISISESWWARFYPQLAMLPVLMAAGAWLSGRLWARAGALLLLVILTYNLALPGFLQSRFSLQQSRAMTVCLEKLQVSPQPVVVYFHWFSSNRLRLKDYGIHYLEVDSLEKLPCPLPERLPSTWVRYCPPPAFNPRIFQH